MKKFSVKISWIIAFIVLVLSAAAPVVWAQAGYNDDRVMIQGFMWESHQDASGKWYEFVKGKVEELASAKFDLIWLPPPSEGEGAGYHPRQLYNFNNNYGTEADQKTLLEILLKTGVEPVADVVINHRNGTGGWATFKNPDWPSSYICSTDEFWHIDESRLTEKDIEIRKRNERGSTDYNESDYPNWDGARDLDHENPDLRKEIKAYLDKMRQLGYRGWRYDMVKGYHPKYLAEYNYVSHPTFAVGEYWDGNPDKIKQWIDGTQWEGRLDPSEKACSAFDFPTQARLKELINNERYSELWSILSSGSWQKGLLALNPNKSVTFLENHDTGWPQKQFDSFPKNEKLLQAYAYILTHPGVPCVYWKHFFDWKFGKEISAFIRARKYAGVHSGSYVKTETHGNTYVAIVGDKPYESSTLIVKIGPGTGFAPDATIWELETYGNGYAVWVRKSKKQETKSQVDSPKGPLQP